MAQFSIRVELHNASLADYLNLHERMAEKGFSRQITNDGGAAFHLIDAMYSIEGSYTVGQVLDNAFAAASTIDPICRIHAVEAVRQAWRGLRPVQPAVSPYAPLRGLLGGSYAAAYQPNAYKPLTLPGLLNAYTGQTPKPAYQPISAIFGNYPKQ